jgi:hypothetical protein
MKIQYPKIQYIPEGLSLKSSKLVVYLTAISNDTINPIQLLFPYLFPDLHIFTCDPATGKWAN